MYRLVVIDDEYIVVEGIKAIIKREQLNCEVVGFAYDGIHGREVIRETNPDLVITDIRIPGLDGLSLIEEVKEWLPNTYFIVISGYNEFEYAKRAITLGVKGYIDKPVTIEKVKQVLEKIDEEKKKLGAGTAKQQMEAVYYEQLNVELDEMIDAIFQEDAKGFQQKIHEIFIRVERHAGDTTLLKNECYHVICVAMEILAEHKRTLQREFIVSYLEMEHIKSRTEVMAYMEQLVEQIVGEMKVNKVGSNHRTIKTVLRYIDEHYNEEIGLNELADMAGVNPAYLSMLFKDEVGMSYVKYLTKMRMEKAKELLLEGKKVVEVSELVGYSNYRYFCDIFKKRTGKTPNEYKGCIRKK